MPGRGQLAKISLDQLVSLESLPRAYRDLASAAIAAHRNAYAPYSKFFVGAALLHTDNSITVGCNWENAIYQSTCAERTAIVAANAAGKRTASAVAVYGRTVDVSVPDAPADSVCTPCGLCRQMLTEVAHLSRADLDVIMVSFSQQDAKVVKLSSLLPDSFGPKDVGLDIAQWAQVGAPVAGISCPPSPTPQSRAQQSVGSSTPPPSAPGPAGSPGAPAGLSPKRPRKA